MEWENRAVADESLTFEKTQHAHLGNLLGLAKLVSRKGKRVIKKREFACVWKELFHSLSFILRRMGNIPEGKDNCKTCPVTLGMWFSV